jgi:hypothetical protein
MRDSNNDQENNTSSNPFDSHQVGSWNSDIPENRGLSKFSKFLAVIFLLLGLLGIIGGTMGASFKALQWMGFDIASTIKDSVDTASPKPASQEPQADSKNTPQIPEENPSTQTDTATAASPKGLNLQNPTALQSAITYGLMVLALIASVGMVVSAIQALRGRRSGSLWLSNWCAVSVLLFLAWTLQSYLTIDSIKSQVMEMLATPQNIPPDVPPERLAELKENLEYFSQVGIVVGLGCAGFFMLVNILLYLYGAVRFRSAAVLDRLQERNQP